MHILKFKSCKLSKRKQWKITEKITVKVVGIKISFEHVDFFSKILLFRTHLFWNSTIELILMSIWESSVTSLLGKRARCYGCVYQYRGSRILLLLGYWKYCVKWNRVNRDNFSTKTWFGELTFAKFLFYQHVYS